MLIRIIFLRRQNYKQIDFRELGNFSEELKQDLENDKEIEAVILNSDFYAIYTEKLLKRFKRRIYVASFDGTQLLDMVSDKIVHIKQPFQEMGKISAELLIKKMNGEDYEKKVYLDYKLIDKGDSGVWAISASPISSPASWPPPTYPR